MKLLIAPAHYILSKTEGSEYTRALEYIEHVASKSDVSGEILVGYSSVKKIGNLRIIPFLNAKPKYITLLLRLRFIWWVFTTSRKLLKKNNYDCIWHIGPFAIGETFSLVALWNRKKTHFVIGPVYTPFKTLGKDDFGMFGKKGLDNPSPLLRIKQRIEREIYLRTSKIFHRLSVKTMHNANAIIAVEEEGKKILKKLGINHAYVVPMGSNEKGFDIVRSKRIPKVIRLLIVNYLVDRKRTQDVLDALDILVNQKKRKNMHLTIVGSGPEKKKLMQFVKDHNLSDYVSFAGFIPRTKLSEVYKNADIFISASTVESMPGVYFEAMAASLPMIVAQNYTSKDFRKYDFGGKVVKAENVKDFADTLDTMLTSKANLSELGKKNYELFKKYYSFASNMERIYTQFLV